MLNIFQELVAFVLARKKYWLLPIIFVFVLIGGLLVLFKGSSMAPFIYSLF